MEEIEEPDMLETVIIVAASKNMGVDEIKRRAPYVGFPLYLNETETNGLAVLQISFHCLFLKGLISERK